MHTMVFGNLKQGTCLNLQTESSGAAEPPPSPMVHQPCGGIFRAVQFDQLCPVSAPCLQDQRSLCSMARRANMVGRGCQQIQGCCQTGGFHSNKSCRQVFLQRCLRALIVMDLYVPMRSRSCPLVHLKGFSQ